MSFEDLVNSNPVLIVSKTTDPYSCKAKKVITGLGYKFRSVELDELDAKERESLHDALKKATKSTLTPYVFIGKKYIGDNKEVQTLAKETKLAPMLQSAGAKEYGKV